MKQNKASPTKIPATDWQILGELELPVVAEVDGVVSAWLTKTLNLFKFQTDFLSKVTKSAQDAAVRARISERGQTELEHIHLRLFVPRTDLFTLYRGQSWGFFRIEKVGTSTENENPFDHSIEVYLYLEG
jgi:hypothetical protein